MNGSYKVLYPALPFDVLHPVAKQPSPFSLYTSIMFLPRKEVLPRKLSRLFVLLGSLRILIWLPETSMVQLGAVAVVTISFLLMKFLPIALYLRRRAPHHCWKPGSIPNNWADVCGFLEPPGSQRFLEGEQTWRLFHSSTTSLGLRPSDQSCHHETWLHLHFVDWNNKWNHQTHYNGNICLKERPASSRNRAQKRSISEILSDHSLSS